MKYITAYLVNLCRTKCCYYFICLVAILVIDATSHLATLAAVPVPTVDVHIHAAQCRAAVATLVPGIIPSLRDVWVCSD